MIAVIFERSRTRSQIPPKKVADWYRSQAKKFNEIADFTEKAFNFSTSERTCERIKRTPEATAHGANGVEVTVEQLEDRVRSLTAVGKGGRAKDYAGHFGTDETTIKRLLDPASRVYMASAGWLRIRE